MRWELAFANERSIESADFPARKEPRPQTIRGPLHIQCNGYGDSGYIKQLVDQVLTWPHIEPSPTSVSPPDTIRIRLADIATDKPSAFLTPREFGRVLVRVPTIYLALPLVCAHWAIVRGWAEPHYLASFGLMPAGAVVVCTPRDEQELGVSYLLFSESYRFACSLFTGGRALIIGQTPPQRRQDHQRNGAPVYPERKLSIRWDPSSAAC